LVDGAAVEWAVFGENLEEARVFLRLSTSFPRQEHLVGLPDLLCLPEDAVLAGFLAEDSLLRSCYKDLADAVREAEARERTGLKDERDKALAALAETESELEQERSCAAELRTDLVQTLATVTSLNHELDKKESELQQERLRVTGLTTERDSARAEVMGLNTDLATRKDELEKELATNLTLAASLRQRQRLVVALATALALILAATAVAVF
jgi:hypothetical protein